MMQAAQATFIYHIFYANNSAMLDLGNGF